MSPHPWAKEMLDDLSLHPARRDAYRPLLGRPATHVSFPITFAVMLDKDTDLAQIDMDLSGGIDRGRWRLITSLTLRPHDGDASICSRIRVDNLARIATYRNPVFEWLGTDRYTCHVDYGSAFTPVRTEGMWTHLDGIRALWLMEAFPVAIQAGVNPASAIAHRLDVSPQAAGAWIRDARTYLDQRYDDGRGAVLDLEQYGLAPWQLTTPPHIAFPEYDLDDIRALEARLDTWARESEEDEDLMHSDHNEQEQ